MNAVGPPFTGHARLQTAHPFEPFRAGVAKRTETALDAFLGERLRASEGRGRAVAEVVSAIRDLSLRGGKRLRPALCALAFKAFGGQNLADIDGALVSLELLQSYLLIHDDWMDQDETRRGGPAVHAMFRTPFGPEANAMAVLCGDHANALSQRALLECKRGETELLRAVRVLADMQEEVTVGQVLDMVPNGRMSPAQLDEAYRLKTGSYTVKGPLLLGAHLAGASSHVVTGLERVANPLGVAFQLQDDWLGVFGDGELGKPILADLYRRKRTLLVALAEEASPKLASLCAAERPSEQDVVEVVSLLHEAAPAVTRYQRALVERSRGEWRALALPDEMNALFDGAVSLMVERRS